jgi:AP endonuclease-2
LVITNLHKTVHYHLAFIKITSFFSGTRIDYTLASKGLKPWFKYSDIQANIMGSDHCPVYADFLDEIADGYDNNTTSAITSPLLSSNFPEFSNQQKKLSNYFTKSSSATPIPSPIPSSLPVTTTITQSPSSSSQSGIKRSISQSQPIHSSPSSTKRAKSNNTAKSPQKSIQSFFSMNRKGITSTTSDTILELTDTKEKETEEKEERAAAADKSEEKDVNIEELIAEAQGKQVTAEAWTSLFSAPDIPRCKVHNEPCLERTVTKKGPNLGRVFYVCAKPIGPKDGPAYEYHCDYFQWKTATK